ncbi:MAG: isoleucine--tRNA ligase, partial [Kiritimatiellae bacterium]|nr:isoleucine--tRNA ligase [Kiritimatiellia bacterium]
QNALGISGAGAIKEFGVDKFNEQCRSMVLKYVSEWRRTVTRMGRWVDFDNDYKTMNFSFMESVWWAFKQLWDQGRIYKSHRIMPYSWKLGTPLSNFEAGSNYKDVQDPAVTVRVKAVSFASDCNRLQSAAIDSLKGSAVYLLIWTTTPWTLPENLAICAGPDIDYVAVRDLTDDARPVYVMADARLGTIFKKQEQFEVVARFKGSELKGLRYEPIFPYFASKADEGAFVVLNDGYVTTDDGTGLVHIAPAYGEDDFRVCRENGMDAFADPLDGSCAFTAEIPEYAGRFCKDCDKDIIRRLKSEGKLVHQATIVHSYPFCDRTDTPLIYRAIDAWYVRVEDIRDKLSANNANVHWMPEYVGEKRFGNWLAGARDWNISRNRFWGSCLPVWINDDDPDDMICVGSAAELEALSGQKVTDLHKHIVDKIAIVRDGKTYHRTPEVLDCWFESGSMPYAQQHYPFERKGDEKSFFPADFIAEGLDQTRGWFYTLMILGTCLFGESPYRNVVVNGLVLAEDGKKMSKRLKNYPDPMEVVEKYGADALRLYMINSPVVRAENLRFSEQGVMQISRDILIPLWNAYSFFVTYANVDGFCEDALEKPSSSNELDRWIVSALETLVADVTAAMDSYDLQRSVRPFVDFIDALTNWYIRRSRRRFWKTQNDGDKLDAYRTLRYVLVQLSKVAAPFTPFVSEAIYTNLRASDMPESVHLCDFPTADASARDAALERRMARIQAAVAVGRGLRTEHDLKVRQPLARIHLVSSNPEVISDLRLGEALVADELNIKEVAFGSDESALAEIQLKADFRKLGPRLGPKMKLAAAAIAALAPDRAAAIARGEAVEVALPGTPDTISLTSADVSVVRKPKAGLVVGAQGEIVAALETELTPELVREGIAREFVKNVQNLRKEADFVVDQRIRISFAGDPEVADAVAAFAEWIREETLADSCEPGEVAASPFDLNGRSCAIAVQKAGA